MLVGLFLHNIKSYRAGHFIPIMHSSQNNLVCYAGENGTGKSAILEALDVFFNQKNNYNMHKGRTECYCVPIFLIEKEKLNNLTENIILNNISNYFFELINNDLYGNIENKDSFFHLLKFIQNNFDKEKYFLLAIGENQNRDVSFSLFENNDKFKKMFIDENDKNKDIIDKELFFEKYKKDFKNILDSIKKVYSYIYVPVETNIIDFANWTERYLPSMCNVDLKNKIRNILNENNSFTKLTHELNTFITNITDQMSLENYKYKYDEQRKRKKSINPDGIINNIIQGYFHEQELYLNGTQVEFLSSGEKRQAMINMSHALLTKQHDFETNIIFAIDEPENSLNIKLCYEQFKKIEEISREVQVLLTTHWYGFIPTINNSCMHIIAKKDDYKASFKSFNLTRYNDYSNKYLMKSNNDLVQTIHATLENTNWLICEGITDKIYLDWLLRDIYNLYIVPLDGKERVIYMYNYLLLSLNNIKDLDNLNGKIFCLIDDDQTDIPEIYDIKNNNNKIKQMLKIQKLFYNINTNKTPCLSSLDNNSASGATIEKVLNPVIFAEAFFELTKKELKIIDKSGNTDFVRNFQNSYEEIEKFFKEKDSKHQFAKKYIEIMSKQTEQNDFIPNWINKIKVFFKESD